MAFEDKPGPGPKSSALQKKRILSGMRPTGKMHLGNYYGALYNWMRLQEDYQCYYFVADWHALTTEYETPQAISGYHPGNGDRLAERGPGSPEIHHLRAVGHSGALLSST